MFAQRELVVDHRALPAAASRLLESPLGLREVDESATAVSISLLVTGPPAAWRTWRHGHASAACEGIVIFSLGSDIGTMLARPAVSQPLRSSQVENVDESGQCGVAAKEDGGSTSEPLGLFEHIRMRCRNPVVTVELEQIGDEVVQVGDVHPVLL